MLASVAIDPPNLGILSGRRRGEGAGVAIDPSSQRRGEWAGVAIDPPSRRRRGEGAGVAIDPPSRRKMGEGAGVAIDPPNVRILSGRSCRSCILHIVSVVLLPKDTQSHLIPACNYSTVNSCVDLNTYNI